MWAESLVSTAGTPFIRAANGNFFIFLQGEDTFTTGFLAGTATYTEILVFVDPDLSFTFNGPAIYTSDTLSGECQVQYHGTGQFGGSVEGHLNIHSCTLELTGLTGHILLTGDAGVGGDYSGTVHQPHWLMKRVE